MALGLVLNRSRQVPAEESPAFGAIAERFRRAGELERAAALCQEGLQRYPEHLSARVTLGWALLDLGRHDDARAELEKVLRRAPDNLAAIRGLAELHDRTENDDASNMQGTSHWLPLEADPPAAAEHTPRGYGSPAAAGHAFGTGFDESVDDSPMEASHDAHAFAAPASDFATGIDDLSPNEFGEIGLGAVSLDAVSLDAVSLDTLSLDVETFGVEAFGVETLDVAVAGVESFGVEAFGVETPGVEKFEVEVVAAESFAGEPFASETFAVATLDVETFGVETFGVESLDVEKFDASFDAAAFGIEPSVAQALNVVELAPLELNLAESAGELDITEELARPAFELSGRAFDFEARGSTSDDGQAVGGVDLEASLSFLGDFAPDAEPMNLSATEPSAIGTDVQIGFGAAASSAVEDAPLTVSFRRDPEPPVQPVVSLAVTTAPRAAATPQALAALQKFLRKAEARKVEVLTHSVAS